MRTLVGEVYPKRDASSLDQPQEAQKRAPRGVLPSPRPTGRILSHGGRNSTQAQKYFLTWVFFNDEKEAQKASSSRSEGQKRGAQKWAPSFFAENERNAQTLSQECAKLGEKVADLLKKCVEVHCIYIRGVGLPRRIDKNTSAARDYIIHTLSAFYFSLSPRTQLGGCAHASIHLG